MYKMRPKPTLTPAQRKQAKSARATNVANAAIKAKNTSFAYSHTRQDAPGYRPVTPTIGPKPDGMSHTKAPDAIGRALANPNDPRFKKAMSAAYGKGRGR